MISISSDPGRPVTSIVPVAAFQEPADSVGTRLRQSRGRHALCDGLRRLHWTDVCVLVEIPPLFEEEPGFPDRIRGALGRALESLAIERRLRDPHAVTSWDLLFGERCMTPNAAPIRPYAIRMDRWEGHWIISVRLFGFVDCWADDVVLALPLAFANGVAIKQGSKHRVRLLHSQAWRRPQWLVSGPCPTHSAVVALMSPLVVRSGRSVHSTTLNLAAGLLHRARAIGSWCDIDLQPSDEERSEMAAAWETATEDLMVASWIRRSANQPRGQVIAGLVGRLTLHRITDIGLGLLAFAEAFHAGGGSASGLGRIGLIEM